jgi:flagellar biosynthetic protein FliQ
MSGPEALQAGQEFLMVVLKVAGPILMFGLVAGVVISVVQAVTMIQEFTLTFVPKLLAVGLALTLFGSWMLATLVNYMVRSFQNIPIGGR